MGQFRAVKAIYRLRGRITALEEQIGQAAADRAASIKAQSARNQSGQAQSGQAAPNQVSPGQVADDLERRSRAMEHQLADLLREQADLLDLSPVARVLMMLPTPARLRRDADLLDGVGNP